MNLPKQYQWLTKESGPRMLLEALKLYGTLEMPGDRDSPTILAWAKEVGLSRVYTHDSIAWCGLFMLVIYLRAGKELPDGLSRENMLWALNWAKVGTHVSQPMLGDILTFKRNGGGHVSLMIAEDANYYHCLGGNQSDSVCISRIAKNRLYRAIRPHYNNQPANVRKIIMSANGPVSENEA